MARLVIISRMFTGSAFDVGPDWMTIGRADGSSIQIPEQSVSGRHCEARTVGGDLLVRDLLSTNGTFVNGGKVNEGVIKPGQTLRIGEVELRYESSTPAPQSSRPFKSKMLVTNLSARAAETDPGKTDPTAETKLAPPPAKPAAPPAPEEEFVVVATYDGKWIPTDGSKK